MEQSLNTITKNMTIGEVVRKYPDSAGVMLKYGLHCIGCHVNPYETIEQGALGHGISEDKIDEMLDEVNDFVKGRMENSGAESSQQDISINNMRSVELTPAAVLKVRDLMIKDNKNWEALRISVISGGCSGMSYDLSFDNPRAGDKLLEFDGLKVVIDNNSLESMEGAKIDFVDGLQGTGFKIQNPKARSTCGCGNSFS